MTRRRFCRRPYDDRGASLVMALIFITVGSVVLMAVLALADTSMQTTIQLSSQANGNAAAEDAANIAVNTLRDGTFGGSGNCFGANTSLMLPNFYRRSDGTQDSARVVCALDPTKSFVPAGPWALLTLDTTVPGPLGPLGISVTNPQLTGPTGSLRVTGDVQSNSNIAIQPKVIIVPSGNLTSSGTIRANKGCTTGSGLFSPTPTCNAPTVADPGYQVPDVGGLPTQAVPPCAPVMTFQPGRYTDFLGLSARTSSSCQGGKGVLHFLPGVYYFEFGFLNVMVPWAWSLTAGTVIGGALRGGVTLGPGMALSNNCVTPIPTGPGWVTPAASEGVTFVFSGGSQMNVSGSAKVELCGRYGGSSAPIAVTAQPATGLLATVCTTTAWPCAAIWTATPTAFVVQGTVYLPTRELVLGLNNTSMQSLHGGAVVRRAWANTSRGAGSAAVIDPTVAERRTVVYLNVFLCAAQSTCISGGQQLLRMKVSIVDPTGVPVGGQRQTTVLNSSLVELRG